MSKLNVIRDQDDPFYRYKMEPLCVIQENLHTAIVNFNTVCGEIDRVAKFMKKHFAASFKYKADMLITKKILSQNEIQEALFTFIEKNILCQICNNPETSIIMNKKKKYMSCKSCGNTKLC